MFHAAKIAALAFLFLSAAGCHSSPAPPPPSIPPGAQATLDKLKAASSASDYATIRSLMEPKVLTEASIDPNPADAVISDWQADATALSTLAGAIDSGCQIVTTDAQVVACPAPGALPKGDADAAVYVIAIRPGADGTWRLYEALYAD